ncbi:hypothetical protein [Undibacterium terreum]|uniref:hypothetical protein n=1 Tax=Undibacterium terreum TaxID=1224302 RepID=UPI0016641E7E|nr:hypothetical protein [Undibacterium terreum]
MSNTLADDGPKAEDKKELTDDGGIHDLQHEYVAAMRARRELQLLKSSLKVKRSLIYSLTQA